MLGKLNVGKLIINILLIVLGLAFVAIGVVCYLKAGLGSDAFTVFYEGLSNTLGISIGRSLQLSLLSLVVVVFFIDRKKLGLGTLMHATLVGFFIDLFMSVDVPSPTNIFARLVLLIFAILIVGSGLAIYINVEMGAGAIDAVMLIVHGKINKNIRWVRISLDFTLALIGFFLGGTIGIGTVLGVSLTGPVLEFVLRILKGVKREGTFMKGLVK